MTFISGLTNFKPVAKARALPWVVCKVQKSTYAGIRPEQPIPETIAILLLSNPKSETARAIAPKTIPFPHPGHQTVGNFLFPLKYSISNGAVLIFMVKTFLLLKDKDEVKLSQNFRLFTFSFALCILTFALSLALTLTLT
jgi:hypothetical protein